MRRYSWSTGESKGAGDFEESWDGLSQGWEGCQAKVGPPHPCPSPCPKDPNAGGGAHCGGDVEAEGVPCAVQAGGLRAPEHFPHIHGGELDPCVIPRPPLQRALD